MRVRWMILADAATAVEGKHYIHGAGIIRLTVQALPAIHPQLAIAVRLDMDPEVDRGPHEIRLQLLSPSEETMTELTFPFEVADELEPFGNEPVYGNFAVTLSGLMFTEPGLHAMRLSVDGKPSWDEPLNVIVA